MHRGRLDDPIADAVPRQPPENIACERLGSVFDREQVAFGHAPIERRVDGRAQRRLIWEQPAYRSAVAALVAQKHRKALRPFAAFDPVDAEGIDAFALEAPEHRITLARTGRVVESTAAGGLEHREGLPRH